MSPLKKAAPAAKKTAARKSTGKKATARKTARRLERKGDPVNTRLRRQATRTRHQVMESVDGALSGNLVKLESSSAPDVLDEAFRHAHSVKGMAASMGFDDTAKLVELYFCERFGSGAEVAITLAPPAIAALIPDTCFATSLLA